MCSCACRRPVSSSSLVRRNFAAPLEMASSLSFSCDLEYSLEKKSSMFVTTTPAMVWTEESTMPALRTSSSEAPLSSGSSSAARSSSISSFLFIFPWNIKFCTCRPRSRRCRRTSASVTSLSTASEPVTSGVGGRAAFETRVRHAGNNGFFGVDSCNPLLRKVLAKSSTFFKFAVNLNARRAAVASRWLFTAGVSILVVVRREGSFASRSMRYSIASLEFCCRCCARVFATSNFPRLVPVCIDRPFRMVGA
mmetsp:Transcript_38981/g.52874  ORF Transcript_38981/g.52874 Transcript_38981/m.52874 type:complete len:251 (-) Transcript_38981:744-1496(-)